MLPIVTNILLAIHVLVSLLIILLVLMQRPKSEGLGAAFGGGMTDNLFGAQSTNVLQTITRWLGGMFFALSLGLSVLYVKAQHKSNIQQRLSTALPAPKEAPKAAPSDQEKLLKEIQNAIEKQKNEPAPAADKPASADAVSPAVKPGEPLPEAAPATDAKPEAPSPSPGKPAKPEKTPQKPPR